MVRRERKDIGVITGDIVGLKCNITLLYSIVILQVNAAIVMSPFV